MDTCALYVGCPAGLVCAPTPAFRYPMSPLMQELLKAVTTHWWEQNIRKEDCASTVWAGEGSWCHLGLREDMPQTG